MAVIDIGIQITSVNRAAPGISQARTQLGGLSASAKAAASALRALQGVLIGIGVTGALRAAKSFVQMAGDLQSLQIRLAGVTGSAKLADDVFNDLTNRFKSAPFDLKAVADGFSRVASSGLDLNKTKDLTSAIVNSVAAFGGGTQEVERAFIGFAQVLGKGSLQMEELRQQIGEQIPSAMQIMAKEAGVSVAEFTSMVSKGMISGTRAVELFTKGAEKAFGGFAEKLQYTINGSMARVKTELSLSLKGLLGNTDIDERIAIVINHVADAVAKFGASITQADIDKFWVQLENSAEFAQHFIAAVGTIGSAIISLGEVILGVLSKMPPGVIEDGILGYMIKGRSGFVIGSAVGAIDSAIAWLAGTPTMTEQISKALNKTAEIVQGPLGPQHTTIFGTMKEELDKATKSLAELNDKSRVVTAPQGLSQAGLKVLDELKTLGAEVASKASGALLPFADDVQRVNDKLRDMGVKLQEDRKHFADLKAQSSKSDQDVVDIAALGSGLSQVDAQIGKIRANLNTFIAHEVADFRDKFEDVILRTTDAMEVFNEQFGGNHLEQQISRQVKATNGFKASLEEALEKATALNSFTHAEGDEISRIQGLIAQTNTLREKAVALVTAQYDIDKKSADLQEKITQSQTQEQIRQLQRSTSVDPKFNAISATPGGQLVEDITAKRTEMSQQILQYQNDILGKQKELLTADEDQRAGIERSIQLYEQLKTTTKSAMDSMTVEGELAKEQWKDIGSAIHNDVADGIMGLIQGTTTFGEVMNRVWADITQSVIKYLLKLAEARLMQNVMGQESGGGGGGFLGSLFGGGGGGGFLGSLFGGGGGGAAGAVGDFGMAFAANGGAFRGHVTPFANGGLLQGPTLFGLAGEAGDEAIMPLTRIGGKLGVRSSGGGGNSYHITVQAIDTQSGMSFIANHIDTIDKHLMHSRNLNRKKS